MITTPSQMPDHWWGPFAIWDGGLGIWGGIAAGVAVGVWYLRRAPRLADVYRFMQRRRRPALLVAQSIGRIGNYFNQELFGKPSTLPWALKISPAHRPAGFAQFATFQPTFLYEIIWNLCLAAVLVWLDNRRKVRPPGLFPLYVAGYSAFRMFEETLRIDYSQHILGHAAELLGRADRHGRRAASGLRGSSSPLAQPRDSEAAPPRSTAEYSRSGPALSQARRAVATP